MATRSHGALPPGYYIAPFQGGSSGKSMAKSRNEATISFRISESIAQRRASVLREMLASSLKGSQTIAGGNAPGLEVETPVMTLKGSISCESVCDHFRVGRTMTTPFPRALTPAITLRPSRAEAREKHGEIEEQSHYLI